MPSNPTITTFNNQTPPWSLAQLDANFSSIQGIINSANNYSNYLPDTGTANSYSVTFPAGVVVSITAGLTVQFKALNTNTGASTLNVNGLGAVNLVNTNGSALGPGQIVAGGMCAVFYDGTNYQLLNPVLSSATSSPVGTSRRQTALIGPSDAAGFPSFLPYSVTGLNLTTQNIAALETAQTANVATPVASPGVVTWTGHTLVGNQALSFTTSGALPTGLTVGTIYYVVPASIAANTFQVSAYPGGPAINFTGSTSGQSVAWAGFQNVLVVTSMFGNDAISGELNTIGMSSVNLTWTGLTNNTTNYLYVTIAANGVMTTGFTTLAPIVEYESVAAISTVAGQITIRLVSGEVYIGNGTSSAEANITVLSTATTSGGNITATAPYNYGKPPVFSSKLSNSLLKVTTYTTAGTFQWIKSPQTTSVRVKVKGGGGAGGAGGSEGSAVTGLAGGGGGGGEGGYAEGLFDASLFNTQTATLASGGSSSFGSLVSATAGATGNSGASNVSVGISALGGIGGTGTGGYLQITGQAGMLSTAAVGSASGFGGTGGGQGGGLGGAAVSAPSFGNPGSVGNNGGGGGGGAGAANNGNIVGQTGGAGGAASVGYIIVEEYA